MKREGYRGYVTCREFGGLQIPVPVQSQLMREYAQRKGLMFKLHVNENSFARSYMSLEGLVADLEGLEGLFVTSYYMLPKRAARRQRMLQQVFDAGGEIHFILENVVVRSMKDWWPIEETLQIYELLPLCPKPHEIVEGRAASPA